MRFICPLPWQKTWANDDAIDNDGNDDCNDNSGTSSGDSGDGKTNGQRVVKMYLHYGEEGEIGVH